MDVSFFVSKIPEKSLHRNTVLMAGARVAEFRREIAAIKSDRRYSAAGHAEQVKKALEKALPYFAGLREQQAGDRRKIDSRKADFVLDPPDRTDIFQELRAQELRRHLLTISLHDRLRLAMSDPEVARAILFAHEVLTGVSGDVRARLRKADSDAASDALTCAGDDRHAALNREPVEDHRRFIRCKPIAARPETSGMSR